MNKVRLFFLVLLVSLLALLQSLGFSLLGIKPDLALLAVIAASFFVEDLLEGLFLVALSALILKFSPGFGKEILLFSLIGAASVITRIYLPWRHFIVNLILIAAGTLTFYLVLAPNLILGGMFLKELTLNLSFGALIFALFSALWQNKET